MKTKNRLKCSVDPKQVNERLSHQPELIELHLIDADLFEEKRTHLEKTIEKLQSLGIIVYLHHPMSYKRKLLDIVDEDKEMYDFYQTSCKILYDICKKYQIKSVLHGTYPGGFSTQYANDPNTLLQYTQLMKFEIEKILGWSEDVFLWENSTSGLFSYQNPYLFDEVIVPLQLPLVHDISHTFIGAKGDNVKLQSIAQKIQPFVKYLHLVDSSGNKHDGLEIGKGRIDWKSLIPYIKDKPFVYEIALPNHFDSSMMVHSREYLEKLFE